MESTMENPGSETGRLRTRSHRVLFLKSAFVSSDVVSAALRPGYAVEIGGDAAKCQPGVNGRRTGLQVPVAPPVDEERIAAGDVSARGVRNVAAVVGHIPGAAGIVVKQIVTDRDT